MSASAGPDIITDGLVLCLDAGNRKSYPGSGTVWRDLAGSNNGTIVNGAGYNSGNLGFLVFDGVNDYLSFDTALLAGRSELTIGMYVYPNVVNNYGSLFAEGGEEGNPFGVIWWKFNILTQIWYTRDTSTGEIGSRNNDLNVNFLTVNSWNYITAVYSVSNGYKRYYINGVQVATTSTSIDALTTSRFPFQSFVGRPTDDPSPTDNYFSGYISNIAVYNRALTPQEILQNYNATKGRFKLT